jgi:hypothetical protein
MKKSAEDGGVEDGHFNFLWLVGMYRLCLAVRRHRWESVVKYSHELENHCSQHHLPI